MISPKKTSFVGTEWLRLELAIELIGDMIALNSERLHIAIQSNEKATAISLIENEIIKLGQERQKCYDFSNSEEIISKALIEYGPELKRASLYR